MKKYTLKREQVIHSNMEEVWSFFSTPINLAKLTPPNIKFEVITDPLPETITTGVQFQYKIRVNGINMEWHSEIQDVIPQKQFADYQLKGPYKYWKHVHSFEEMEDGKVLMTDVVTYALPMGILGQFAHWLFVKRQLKGIFDYRIKVVDEVFGA